MRTLTKEMQSNLTPQKAIQLLKDGNQRFVSNLKFNRNLLQQVNETSDGQHPLAFILSCIDSRTSAELIFDQGLGDVFSCRIAGNILNEDILGSMEFACKVAGSKVVVVLGHSKCGAVKGACDNVKLGNLTTLLEKLKPAVDAETTEQNNRTAANAEFVEKVAQLNVHLIMQQIPKQSQVIAEMLDKGEISIIGGMYDVDNGIVDFYEDEIMTGETFNMSDLEK
jgi:carbonic anhydrase